MAFRGDARSKEPMKRRLDDLRTSTLFTRYWLPAILYIGAIFFVSAQPRLNPPQPFPNVDKVYHTLEYMLLGFLLARVFWVQLPGRRPLVVALVALSVGVLIGTADELFQSTVPGRISSGVDLFADTIGLVIAQLLFLALARDPLVTRD